MKKVFTFGKIDYNNRGRKINLVKVSIELKEKECINFETMEKETMFIFSGCGEIWNSKNTDIECGGQCLDTIKEFFPNNVTFNKIFEIWNEYHLNDLHAGNKEQTEAVENWKKETGLKYDYTLACNYLKSVELYEINGYKYGHGWLCKPIPENVVDTIKELMGEL